MASLPRAKAHLFDSVLPAAAEYFAAEQLLSAAYEANGRDLNRCEVEAKRAKRLAANVAVALDGLADRAAKELNLAIDMVRNQVQPLCRLGTSERLGCIMRVRAVADAYKHDQLTNPAHAITSNDDILIVAPGYGIDGYGVGKFGGVELVVDQHNGDRRKFLGDVPAAVRGWLSYMALNGVSILAAEITVCNVKVWP
jgi:hypothetical protein